MSFSQISQDLRARFGIILALALLPLLVFTVWQAYNQYLRDVSVQSTLLEDVASDAVRQVVDTVTTTKAIMRIAAETMDPVNCNGDITHILKNFPRLYNIVMSKPDGTVYCTGRLIRSPAAIQQAAQRVAVTRPFYIDLPEVAQSNVGPENVVVITYGRYEGDRLDRVVLAGFDISLLKRLKDQSELPEGTEISLLSPTGKVLLGEMGIAGKIRREGVFKARGNENYTAEYMDEDNQAREIMIINAKAADLYIAISTPQADLLSRNKLRPLASSIIPLLAWIFGFGAIWLSTDRLILVHLRKMRGTILGFARGHTDVRIGRMKDAPDTIEDLASAFDRMADRVEKREGELRESLDDKETLLREIHHRVKNNLQIVISLLNMQERKLKDPQGLEALRESKNRVNAIALVHKSLYESDDISLINMESFINQIVTHLRRALLTDRKQVSVALNVSCPPMDSDRATPIALFIVEAMTNSMKHGVKNGGKIDIAIQEIRSDDGHNMLCITVKDSGKGTPKERSEKTHPEKIHMETDLSSGMGTKLMSGFARQLSGSFKGYHMATGYAAELKIPAAVHKSSASHI